MLDANTDISPQPATPSPLAASTVNVQQRPASSWLDTPAPPTYSQVVQGSPSTIKSNVGAAGSQI